MSQERAHVSGSGQMSAKKGGQLIPKSVLYNRRVNLIGVPDGVLWNVIVGSGIHNEPEETHGGD